MQRASIYYGKYKKGEILFDGKTLSYRGDEPHYKWLLTESVCDRYGNKYDPKTNPAEYFRHLPELYNGSFYVRFEG